MTKPRVKPLYSGRANETLCSERPEVGEDLLAEEPNLRSQFG